MEHLYVHIPFCKKICSYCDFAKLLDGIYNSQLYLQCLKVELESRANLKRFDTIYIGGGTPNILCDSDFEFLLKLLNSYKKEACEFSIEINVESMSTNKMKLMQKYGVNRISIGVQTFNSKLLVNLEREHTVSELMYWLNVFKKNHFNNISIDLMYALPFQTIDDIKNDLSIVEDLLSRNIITHLSYYALQLEENTKFRLLEVVELQDEVQEHYYRYIEERLISLNLNKYEISNFAINGYQSQHNLGYWLHHDYVAVGLGAHGFIENRRYENTKSMNKYLSLQFELKEEFISFNEQMEEYMILGLRLVNGINKNKFFEKFGLDIFDAFPIIIELINTSNLIVVDNYIRVPNHLFFEINFILEHFVT